MTPPTAGPEILERATLRLLRERMEAEVAYRDAALEVGLALLEHQGSQAEAERLCAAMNAGRAAQRAVRAATAAVEGAKS